MVLTAARDYREAMRGFAAMRNLEVWYARLDVETVLGAGRQLGRPKAVKRVREGRRQGAGEGQPAGARPASPTWSTASCGFVSDPPLLVPAEELLPATRSRDARGGDPRSARRLPREPASRSPAPARRLPLPPPGPQGGRGRQRRHPRLDRPADRRATTPTRSFLQAKEAEASVLEPYAGESRFKQPRPPGGRGPAADAGGQRQLPRLVPGGRRRRQRARLLRAPALGLEALGRGRDAWRRAAWRSTRGCAAGRWPAPTRAPATRSRSAPTSAPARPSTRRSPSSPSSTPTRTSATTPPSSRRSTPGRIEAEEA